MCVFFIGRVYDFFSFLFVWVRGFCFLSLSFLFVLGFDFWVFLLFVWVFLLSKWIHAMTLSNNLIF